MQAGEVILKEKKRRLVIINICVSICSVSWSHPSVPWQWLCSRPQAPSKDPFILLESPSLCSQLLPYLGFSFCAHDCPICFKACATLLRGLFESIPPWIILQVKSLCGGAQFENGLTCRFNFSLKHLSKLVHLEMLHMADRVSVWI